MMVDLIFKFVGALSSQKTSPVTLALAVGDSFTAVIVYRLPVEDEPSSIPIIIHTVGLHVDCDTQT